MCGYSPELRYYKQQQSVLDRVTPLYINKIVDNLEDRFQDSNVVSAMKVLIPSEIRNSESVGKFGNEEVNTLITQYNSEISSAEDCVSEYQQYKRLVVGNFSDSSLLEEYSILQNRYNDILPNMITLLKCCLVLPMTSVQCERGFSTQNRIKSNFRTSMNNTTLDDLMRISEDGPSIKEFEFKRALTKWKSVKSRKIYK